MILFQRMKIPILLASLIILLSVNTSSPSYLNDSPTIIQRSSITHIVDQSGNGDFITISDAIDAANNGDTIQIFSGKYKESFFVNKTLTFHGNNSSDTILFIPDSDESIIINSENCVFENLLIKSKSSRGVCIILNSDNNEFENCDFRYFGIGINSTKSSNNIIKNCNFSSYHRDGISLEDCESIEIINCNFLFSRLMIYKSEEIVANNCVLNRSEIDISDSNNVVVKECKFQYDGSSGSIINSSNCEYRNNKFFKCSNLGLSLVYATNNTIDGNEFQQIYGDGIKLFNSNSNVFTNNEFLKNQYYAVLFINDLCGETSISENNLFYNNRFLLNTNDYRGSQADIQKNNKFDFEGVGNYWSSCLSPDDNNDNIIDEKYLYDEYPISYIPEFDLDNDHYMDYMEDEFGSDRNDASSTPPDLDSDYIPDELDNDVDGDGWSYGREKYYGTDDWDPEDFPPDLDGDMIVDEEDEDRDGDGVKNWKDPFPDDPNKSSNSVFYIILIVIILIIAIIVISIGIFIFLRKKKMK